VNLGRWRASVSWEHPPVDVTIAPANLDATEFGDFVRAHLADMEPTAPPESRHALNLDGLRAEGVRVWVALLGDRIVGTIALAPVAQGHEELKSMRTDPAIRRRGIGTLLLDHVAADARARSVTRLSLETGSMAFFEPARTLYRRHGFVECAPFGAYREDPRSCFLTRVLGP
jgi:putative acetyltransferase